MAQHKNSLFEAFHADHAVLGRGFHELSQCLRNNDLAAARQVAQRVDADAGAHIAFEEEHFYKALLPLLGAAEVEKMYREHEDGLEVVQAVIRATAPDEQHTAELLEKSQAMEAHIAECGDLFAAMGRIPPEQQAELHRHLLKWRDSSPRWSDFAASRASSRST
ncbi:MAG: hemerythrin domain-containing protein [Betaproteobacteria bacterium]|nr:MAG: hemerythrin domain-containing protein [Betaproteobacteria bacterium]